MGLTSGMGTSVEFTPDPSNSAAYNTAWAYYNLAFKYGFSQRMASITAATPTPAPVTRTYETPKGPKVAAPELFDGTRANFKNFVLSLRQNFDAEPSRYDTESKKILMGSSHLAGPAKFWWNSQLNELTGLHEYRTFQDWYIALKAAYDDPDARQTAENKLRNLRQGTRDASVYFSEFMMYASLLHLDEATKISAFRRGLSPALQTALAYNHNLPTDFNGYTASIRKTDNQIRALPVYTRLSTQSSSPSPAPSLDISGVRPYTAVGTVPGPMDMPLAAGVQAKLIQAQKDYGRPNNLCLYCDQEGHFAFSCSSKRLTVGTLDMSVPPQSTQ